MDSRHLPSRHALLLAVLLAPAAVFAASSAVVSSVPFVNGGITKDEADAMRQEAPRYPLEV